MGEVIGITTVTRHTVRCSQCGVEASVENRVKKQFIDDLRDIGWSIGLYCTCPSCKDSQLKRPYNKKEEI